MEHMEKRTLALYEFEANANASFTTNEQAGRLQKDSFVMIRGRPCKVCDVSRKAPGKHGAAKCHFVGKDIFTGVKMELVIPAHATAEVPIVSKTDYMLMYPSLAAPEMHVSLMDAMCKTRADLKLPADDDIMTRIKAAGEDKEVTAVVLASCGLEQIVDVKVATSSTVPN